MPEPIDGDIKALLVKTRDDIKTDILTEVATLIEGANTGPLSDFAIKADIHAAPHEELRILMYFALLNAYTPYASEEALGWKGETYQLERKPATKATLYVSFGKPQAEAFDRAIPAYQQFLFGENLYQTTADGVITAGQVASDPIPVESVGEGTGYNVSAGLTGQIIDPPVGVVTVTSGASILDAEDIEPLEDWRARVLEWERERVSGGNDQDYATWAKEIVGVSDAYAYALRRGLNTVDVAVRSYDNGGVPDVTLLDAIFAYIVGTPIPGTDPVEYTGGKRPMTADVQFWPATVHTQDITAQVTPKTGYTLADIQPDIEAAAAALLSAIKFRGKIKVSDIRDILHDHPKIDDYDLTVPAANYDLAFAEIATLGVVTLT